MTKPLLILDIGNVLLETSFEKVNTALGLATQDFEKDEVYFCFCKGERSSIDYFLHIKSKYQLDLNFDRFCECWNMYYTEIGHKVAEVVPELSKKYYLAALSNSNIIHALHSQRKFNELFNHFKNIYYSFMLGSRKPENKIFENLLTIVRQDPRLLTFVDDKEENIEAAKSFGINSHIFKDIRTLENLL